MRRIALLLALLVPAPAFAGESVRSTAEGPGESPGGARTRGHVVGDRAKSDAFLAAVRAHLASSKSEIGRNTFDAIENGTILLDTLDSLSVSDCRRLVEENPRQWIGVVHPDECVEGRVPAKIIERVSGYQHENRIYVRVSKKIPDAAATVVHETNHVVNRTHEHYATPEEILEEEYRAYYVTLLYQDGRAPASGYLSWLKSWIVEQYVLGIAPATIADVPAGILDNEAELAEVVETPLASIP